MATVGQVFDCRRCIERGSLGYRRLIKKRPSISFERALNGPQEAEIRHYFPFAHRAPGSAIDVTQYDKRSR